MNQYEVHVWVNSQCLKLTISANSQTQAKQIAEAQYPAASMINVLRKIN